MGVPGSSPGGRKIMAEERLADPCRGLRDTAGECWQDYITNPKAPGQPGDPGPMNPGGLTVSRSLRPSCRSCHPLGKVAANAGGTTLHAEGSRV